MAQLGEHVGVADGIAAGAHLRGGVAESLGSARAHGLVRHCRPKDWVKDPRTGLLVPDLRWRDSAVFGPLGEVHPDCVDVLLEDEAWNLVTNAGRIFLHTQCYSASPAGNGLNFMGLSNDTVTEIATSTVLSNEITTNGLARASATITLPTGSGNQTTAAKTFTASGSQGAQKGALFTASSAGTMNHVLAFTPRSLLSGDTLALTFTLTLA